MKNLSFIIIFLCFNMKALSIVNEYDIDGGDSVYTNDQLVKSLGVEPNTDMNDSLSSHIIFYKDYSFLGFPLSYKIFVGDSMVIKLRNNSYYKFSCLSGEYKLQIEDDKTTKLYLQIEKGKTYYVRLSMKKSKHRIRTSSDPELVLIDSVTGYDAVHKSSKRELSKDNTPLFRYQNKLGIIASIGGGFHSIPVGFAIPIGVATAAAEEVGISYGGGVGLGIKYGYEFHRHFDLSTELNYKISYLIPHVENGDLRFTRWLLSCTPSYILPIDGGDAIRFKMGPGIDYYFSNKLAIETDKVAGGFNDTWTYSNTIGYHVNIICEFSPSLNWSFNFGLKWYNISYSFAHGGVHSSNATNKFQAPDGSGLEFSVGLYLNF